MTAHGLRYDVNLSILFTELPLLARPAAAAEAGFDAVEFWWPFATPAPADREVGAFLTALDDAGVRLVGLNFDAGDLPAGDRGLLSQPPNSARFRDNIDVAVGIARATGCRALNALYGNRLDGVRPAEQDDLALENLALAAKAADGIGAVVLLEPLNAAENPAYPLRTAADALGVIDRLDGDRDNVRLLFDLYHLASNGEDLPRAITAYGERIGHVQIADVPGRHQPGSGALDIDALLVQLEGAGYRGYVGCEYRPLGTSVDSLDWLPRRRRAATRG